MLWARQIAPESPSWACLRAADPPKIPIDPNGNLTTKAEGTDAWTYTWNAENQLTRVEKNGVEQARFAYDPMGRRVEKLAWGVTTTYTYDNAEVIREVRGVTTLKYVHGLGVDVPLAADDGTSVSYFHADGLASIVKVTGAAGAVTTARQYDSWGNIEGGTSDPGYAFTGREWEPETGLYYYRARYYDARAGRFVSEDPIGFEGGDNFYAYVGDNPATWVDPFGLMAGAMVVGTPAAFNPRDPECVAKCWFDRVLIYVGIAGFGASQPTVAKPGGVGGGGKSGPVTSPASKVLRKCFPQKIPKRILGTTTAGGVAARALPALSAGLILWDVINVLRCVDDCPVRDVCPKPEGDCE